MRHEKNTFLGKKAKKNLYLEVKSLKYQTFIKKLSK